DLTFTYQGGERAALSNVSLKVPAGATVAFMGEVGSGKSTILAMLSRLYDPPASAVFLDGRDIRELPLDWLRNQVASVPQETFLFSETILENIGFGEAAAERNPEELKRYAQVAQIEADILEFPKGYDTMLGERGVNLSGGQKQRVAIARALACQPKVLLLDDCLSAVDAATEAAIFGSLGGEVGKCTCLIASHRVSAVRNADVIVVLGQGRVIEQGTHEELVKADGWYADLNRKQALAASIEEA
ncbi:MAG: ATP-binding cassette domain-containing protein, partial [Planctomycetes bacterium]|nr:ATP-binding cassette domain-containing protein [Planctomycetota bacterium]